MNVRLVFALYALVIFSTHILCAQAPNGKTAPPGPPDPSPVVKGNYLNGGPKPYSEIINSNAKTSRGLFITHRLDDKYYLEIPDTLINREILIVNRISKAPAGTRAGNLGYAGDQIAENVIIFEKGPNNKIFLRSISYQEVGRDSAGMYQSVRNSNLQPIAAAFDIKAFSYDSLSHQRGSVIEMTDYLMGDNEILFFDNRIKRALGIIQYQRENSYIIDVRAFPNNIEIQTTKSYIRTPLGASGTSVFSMASGSPTTFELNSSMVLLPKIPMKPRYYDPRIGYFSTGYTDYDANPQGIEEIRMITRWRLEPKPEDINKYLSGVLVEPQKQIVYFIDPATPRKWVPYIIQGVNDWNIAFEKAGFKNAIIAKMAPVNDSTWSIEDASHSAIVYKPSEVSNASGPHIHDPRSGEILETHINWYHNVMNLVRNWYFIQTAAVDPMARMLHFSDTLMGQLIRYISAHEVGHTLGLRHNFGASSTVPVEKLRNKAWVEANGHTPSIMDYARFNYVAQPEDSISEKGLFPRIGVYDKWAIEWGYKYIPQAKTPQQEVPLLNQMTLLNQQDKRYWFGSENDPDDPRGQSEDLGDNAMKAGTYGIKNLQRIVTKLPEWTKEANKDYSSLHEMYDQLVAQFARYMGHAAKNIGGIYTTPKLSEEPGRVVAFVPKTKQKEAMIFLQKQLFTTPKWLILNNISDYTGDNKISTLSAIQEQTLNRLLGNNTFNKLFRFEAESPDAYSVNEMVGDLRKGIWNELKNHHPIDIYRRNLQKAFVEKMIYNLQSDGSSNFMQNFGRGLGIPSNEYSKTTDAISIVRAQLGLLAKEIKKARAGYKDSSSLAHLEDVLDRITAVLNPRTFQQTKIP
ncbi:MAG: zinc-dependent metalloprotease [Flavisolibacter sp.]